MKKNRPTKIGNVELRYLSDTPTHDYADEAEDELLDLFSKGNVAQKRAGLLASKPKWATYYHLTEKRGSLLRWYEFKPGARVLEIGAGCGAVTEELVKKPVEVSALELTPKRSLINAHRNKGSKNLEILVGNLEDYSTTKKFEYIVCVGVLEYAGSFFNTHSPYADFLKKMASLLNADGTLLLAIENRLGLKYWAGALEDHTGKFFEGQNGYPSKKRVQTFGKKELENILSTAGFENNYFYYPFPDYKTPSFIYSDDYHPGNHTSFPLNTLPAPQIDRHREHFFSEQNAIKYIEQNQLFTHFSNSFLVEATK